MIRLAILILLIMALMAQGTVLSADAAPSIHVLPDGTIAIPPASQQALAYYDALSVVWATRAVCGAMLLFLLCLFGIGARIRDFIAPVCRTWYLQVAGCWCLLSLLLFAVMLPLDYWRFAIYDDVGLGNQSFANWVRNQSGQALLSAMLGALVLWVPYGLLRMNLRRPWLFAWLLTVPFVVVMTLVWPVFVDPIFSSAKPLVAPEQMVLKERLEQLAERAGIARGRIFVADTSRHSNALNARVTGIGGSQRIELSDNLLTMLSPDQAAFAMAHEIGHYVLHHAWQDVAIHLLALLALFFTGYAAAQWAIERYARRLGCSFLGDPASLPLIMFLLAIGAGIIQPLKNTFYRYEEREADAYALELTRDNRAAAETFVMLQHSNLSVPRPNPVLHFLRDSHPSLAERIEFANSYAPWRDGKPLKFSTRMKAAPAMDLQIGKKNN